MSKTGDVYENPVTGERVVVRAGTEDTGGGHLIVDLYVAPGGAVAGEHAHQDIEETFTVVRGIVGFRLDGHEDVAESARRLLVSPGVVHEWWNAGQDEAHVIVELPRHRDGFRVARLPAYGKRMAFTSNQDGGDDMDLRPVDSAGQKRLTVDDVPRRRLRRVF